MDLPVIDSDYCRRSITETPALTNEQSRKFSSTGGDRRILESSSARSNILAYSSTREGESPNNFVSVSSERTISLSPASLKHERS
jgi:hypothetical protein